MSRFRAEERARLAAAARAIPLEEDGRPRYADGTDILNAEPRAVFAISMQMLRKKALGADRLSDYELMQFQYQLGLLLAGLRATCVEGECRRRCEEELKRCQEPDPDSGQPHLDCFMLLAVCLFQCSSEKGSRYEG